jgi:hypothetical protein
LLCDLLGINGCVGLAAFEAVDGRWKTVPLAKLTTLLLRLRLEFVAERGNTAASTPGSKSNALRGSGALP